MNYPKLVESMEIIKMLARDYKQVEQTDNPTHFASVKYDGEEFDVFVAPKNITSTTNT